MKQTVYFLAKCAAFTSEAAHPDVNGLMPLVLTPIGGQSPRGRNIVSGTIAESEGFEAGKTYLVMANHTGQVETEDGEVTDSFNYTMVAEYDKKETIDYVMEHPLQEPLIAPQNIQDLGDPTSTIQVVKGNPRARRIRERNLDTTARPSASNAQRDEAKTEEPETADAGKDDGKKPRTS